MISRALRAAVRLWVAVALVSCAKGEQPVAQGAAAAPTSSASSSPCAHAACSDHFFVEAAPGECAAGARCDLQLKVVATGDYHINDDYPYRFNADEAPGVAFLGSNPAESRVFSKSAGDWQKAEPKAGTMKVRFTPAAAGSATIAGTLKVSVCSAENCLLEQPKVRTIVAAK
jgi:hypothetical protein